MPDEDVIEEESATETQIVESSSETAVLSTPAAVDSSCEAAAVSTDDSAIDNVIDSGCAATQPDSTWRVSCVSGEGDSSDMWIILATIWWYTCLNDNDRLKV